MIQQTSLTAYLDNLSKLGANQQRVLKIISTRVGICDQEIAKELNWPINCVTGRRRELVEMGHIEEAYKGKYSATNRTVIFWKLKERKLENSLLQFAEVE